MSASGAEHSPPQGMPRAATALVTFLLITVFYTATAPTNHSIADDPYYYAKIIATEPVLAFPHPRAMLWISTMQSLYQAVATIVDRPDPFLIVGVASAAQMAFALILMLRILVLDFGLRRASALLTVALFGCSYGIWRYAGEIEVYATSTLLSLLLLHMMLAAERNRENLSFRRTAALAAAGGLSSLAYLPLSFLPAIVVPCYLAIRGYVHLLPFYFLISGAVVLFGFGGAYLLSLSYHDLRFFEFLFFSTGAHAEMPGGTELVQAIYGFGSGVLATEWMHAHQSLRDLLRSVPAHYAASQAEWRVWIPFLTLPVLFGVTVFLAGLVYRQRPRQPIRAAEAMLTLWFLLHVGMKLVLAPRGTEGWLLTLVPLSILVGGRIINPAIIAGRLPLVVVGLAALFVHNGVAGISIIHAASTDYFRERGIPLVEQTGPQDLIVLGVNWHFELYMRYQASADVLSLSTTTLPEIRNRIRSIQAQGGQILVLDDAIESPNARHDGDSAWAAEHEVFVQYVVKNSVRVRTGKTGFAYQIRFPKQ